MKTKILLLITLLCVTSIDLYSDNNPKKETQSPSKQEIAVASKTIKEFYVAYTTIVAGSSLDQDKLLPNYVTSKAIEKIKRIGKDNGYDIVIRAQDFIDESIKTITVTHVSGDWYAVAYFENYTKECVIIPVRVIKLSGHYMIDDIAVK